MDNVNAGDGNARTQNKAIYEATRCMLSFCGVDTKHAQSTRIETCALQSMCSSSLSTRIRLSSPNCHDYDIESNEQEYSSRIAQD